VIAHEVGHALQDRQGDKWLATRSVIVPAASLGSSLAPWLIIAGLWMHLTGLAVIGVIGFGLAFARYKNTGAWCAVVAEVEAGVQLRVRRLTIAVDVGLAINPDGVRAQIEGGAIQATSWALKEAVRFDGEQITSDAWERYLILRFSEVPAVDVHIVPSQAASVGAGEASLGPTAAAIANALFDALKVRVRHLPLTAERIVATMDEAGR